MAFSPSGEKLAYVAHDSSITVVDGANGKAYVLRACDCVGRMWCQLCGWGV